jgi:hypothetical protein
MPNDLEGWFEYTTIGAMYALAALFAALTLLGIDDIRVLGPALQTYAAYIVPGFVAVAYLLGSTFARLRSVVADILPESARRLIRGPRVEALVNDPGHGRFVRFLNRGSEALVRQGQSFRHTLTMFQSLMVAVPLVTLAFAVWAWSSPLAELAIPAVIVAVVGEAILFVAHRAQYVVYYSFVAAAKEELSRPSKAEAAPTLPA